MRVLFFFGGIPHYLVALLNAISKHGVEVSVIIPKGNGKTLGKGVKENIDGANFNIIRLEEYKTWYGKLFFSKVNQTINTIRPDIIVIGWPYVLSLFFRPLFLFKLKLKKIKIIFREIPFQVPPFHGTINYIRNNPIYDENLENLYDNGIKSIINVISLKWIRKFYYSVVDATINYCDKAYEIQSSYGVNKEKIFISYNTPDTNELFRVKNLLEKEPSILPNNIYRLIHVGRLVKWKRVDLLISVTAKLKKKYPNTELIIIGNGPETENLKKNINKLGIESSIIWPGAVYKYEDLGKYYNASSIYVLAGLGGLSINEAMGFGKAIICSTADGTETKLVNSDYNGFIFKDEDEDDLYEKIEYLFSRPELLTSFGKNSEKIIREEINLESVSNVFYRAFQYVLKK